MGNPYFKHRSVHKYTRVARGRDGVKIKSMIDLVLVKRDMLLYWQDVRVVRGMGRGQYREGYGRSLERKVI